jgi:HNH endonuclease
MDELKSKIAYDPTTGHFQWIGVRRGRPSKNNFAGNIKPDGYVQIEISGKRYYAHRLAWFFTYGVWPDGDIDHKNHNKSDNRIDNLRDVSHRVNSINRKSYQKNNTHGTLGITYNKKNQRWYATFCNKHQGSFLNEEDASIAYLKAKKEYRL